MSPLKSLSTRPSHDTSPCSSRAFATAAATPGPTRDLTQLVRLLLSRHEIIRRAETLRYAENIVDAYLALGDLDAARGLVGEGISKSKPYEIVDALVLAGRVEDARHLFDEVEPLASAPTYQMRYDELAPWAERVHQFRQPDQIAAALARLIKPLRDNEYGRREADELGRSLRFDIGRAAISDSPDTDIDEVMKRLEIAPEDRPYLCLSAASAAWRKNEPGVRCCAPQGGRRHARSGQDLSRVAPQGSDPRFSAGRYRSLEAPLRGTHAAVNGGY